MHYSIRPDIYYDYRLSAPISPLPAHVSFLRGARISEPIERPIIFASQFSAENPPKPFAGMMIPLWSDELVETFRACGVDNFDCYSAVIRAKNEETEWSGYCAVNVLGLVAGANMAKSEYIPIMSTPGGAPYAGFTKLVLDADKVGTLALFRLAEDPEFIVVHERVIEALKHRPRAGGWGITARKIESA